MTHHPDTRPAAPEVELDRQLATLRDLGYPSLAGISAAVLDELGRRLRGRLPQRSAPDAEANGTIPFLLVVSSRLVPTVDAVARWRVRGRPGFTDMADELADYRPIEGVRVPEEDVYLLVDVDTGADLLGVTPNDALPVILGRGRTPLTVDEGVALVTQFPDVFESRNAFQSLGSRAGNKRVPSFWMSKGQPRLGWCWAGNPHPWLGAASAAARQGTG